MRDKKDFMEMELVGGGLTNEEQGKIRGGGLPGRCVCSSGSSTHYIDNGYACQCEHGSANASANKKKASDRGPDNPKISHIPYPYQG